jgi:putative ABC transport system permease protein
MTGMNSLRFYIRNILKNKIFSAITIGSFAVSLAVILILSSFLVSEYSYDSHIKDADRIYRVVASKNEAMVPEQARQLLLSQVPEISSATNFMTSTESVVYNGLNYNVEVINSDEGLFSVLPVQFKTGIFTDIFKDKSHVVITESLSKKIFGNEDPVGKPLRISHKEDVTVGAVINDFPEKSTLTGELICSKELRIRYSQSCTNDICTTFYPTLVKLKSGASFETVNSKLNQVIPKIRENDDNKYSLSPYKNVYFNTSLSHDSLRHCNVKLLKLLFWLTAVLLLLAVFNYINLSVAQNTSRFKEYGVRQTMGAGPVVLFFQFVGEAFFTIFTAAIIALFLTGLIKPLFVELLGKNFRIANLFSTPQLISISVTSLVLIALVSAIYPARLALKTSTKDMLQKKVIGKISAFDIRKSLNVIQFAATIAIIVSLIAITRQLKYVKTIDFGFNTGQLIKIPIHWRAADKAGILKNEFNSIPGVKYSCFSHGIPGDIQSYSQNDEFGRVSEIISDYSFVETFGLPVIAGRNFTPGEERNVCLINKTAMKQAGWDNIEGKKIFGSEVVGLLDDFHYQDLYNKIGGLMITNGKDVSFFTVRLLPGNITGTLEKIKETFKKVLPDYDFSFSFYDDFLDSMYKQDEKRAESVKIISLIAILISCVGLIGLVEFSTRYRIKEIGIRKVNGARVSEIMLMLDQDFIKWVSLAFIIATPIAWYAMHKWLESFAYKTELNWWIFVLAGLLTAGIALLTVGWQSWRAATRNPVESLRYE